MFVKNLTKAVGHIWALQTPMLILHRAEVLGIMFSVFQLGL